MTHATLPGRSSRLFSLLAAFTVALGLASSATAATVRWDGGGGTSAWTTGANWSTNVVPTSADDVILDNTHVAGSYSVVLSGVGRLARSLQVGYTGNTGTISLTITGSGGGSNLLLGGAPGYDLVIAQGGVLANQSTVSGSNGGLKFANPATDSWQMSGNGTYVHQQNAGSFLNVAAANVSFAATSTFELRSGITTNWGGSGGGLSVIKTYGDLKINPSSATTLNLRVATDSLLVTGNLLLFNSALTFQLSNTAVQVLAHVLGDVVVTDAELYVSGSSSDSRLVVDGNVISSGAAARVGAATPTGNRTGRLVIGGNLDAYYAGSSTNEKLIFWKPGSSAVSVITPEAGSAFRTVLVQKAAELDMNVGCVSATDDFIVADGGTLDFNGYNVTGAGAFDLQAGGTLKITSPDGIQSSGALGNVQTTGTRTFSTNSIYWYKGNSDQVTGTAVPATVRSLVIQKTTSSRVVTLVGPLTLSSNLTLTTGRLALSDFDLTLTAGAAITGGSSASYVQNNAGPSAAGQLVRQVPNTDTPVLFPVGTSSYTPAILSQTASGTTDNFSVRAFTGTFKMGTTGESFTVNVVNRTWLIEESVAGGSNASLTLQWSTGDEQPSFERLSTRIRQFVGGSYDLAMANASADGTDPYTLTRTGLTSFSPFIIGDGTVPLPVELVRFNAHRVGAQVRLIWATAQERNNAAFEIERSTTPTKGFTTVGRVAGQGTSLQAHEYTWVDATAPAAELVYYRLRQLDFDGKTQLSPVVAVRISAPTMVALHAYPNPVAGQLTVELPAGTFALRIFDTAGRPVRQWPAAAPESAGLRLLNLDALPPGAYVLEVYNELTGERQRQSLVCQ